MSHLLWQQLEDNLHRQIAGFPGVAGIAVKDLTDNLTLAINADELFPTASTIKVHILVQLLMRAAAGEVNLQERIPVQPEQHVYGSGVLAYLQGPVEMTLLDIAILMIIASDNTATNLCLEYAGIEATNRLLETLGLTQTKVRRKMMDHLAAVREQENVSTPAELVRIFELLHTGQPSPVVAEQCLEILKKPKQGFLDRALPADLPHANKPGYVPGARCDAGLVYLPRRPYLVAIMTKYTACLQEEHERFIVKWAETIHTTLDSLSKSNRYGRPVY
ncbi:MAG: serine hydrolase [Caldilineaceae bacterium]